MAFQKNTEDEIKRIEELTKTVYRAISLNEAYFLYHLAKEGPGNGVIVEIGSLCGYSTIWLAKGSKSAKREKVYAIDPQNTPLCGNNEAIFRENVKKAGVKDYIIPLIMTSEEAAKNWNGTPIRLLFIDGNHEYDYVKKDFLLWEQYLINGGVIVFHDCFFFVYPDVLRCAKENIFNSDNFGNLGVIDTILYAFKKDSLTSLEKIKKEKFIELLTPLQNIDHGVEKALIYVQEGKLNKAEGELKEAERIIQVLGRAVSDFGKIIFNLRAGGFYLEQEKYQEAEERYNEALSLEDTPDHLKIYVITGLANLYTQQSKYQEAEERYSEALSLGKIPDPIRFHAVLGVANLFSQKGEYIKAEERYSEALSLGAIDSQRFQVLCGLANLYFQQGKYQEAEERYSEALSLEGIPDFQRFHAIYGLANLYSQQAEYKDAEERYKEALSLENIPDRAKIHAITGLGNLYFQQKKYKEAEVKYNEALSLGKHSELVLEMANLHYNKGSMYEKRGLFKEAEKEFKEILGCMKRNLSYRETKRGRNIEGGAHFHLGCISKREGDSEKAKHHFKESLRFIPNHKKAKESLESLVGAG